MHWPDMPTFAEAGFHAQVGARWAEEMGKAMASTEIAEKFGSMGVRPGTLGSAGYTAMIREELAKWREVIRAGNIKAD